MSIERMLKAAIETGKVEYGIKQCKKSIDQNKAKLLILASNCPDEDLKYQNVKVHNYGGTNVELGTACGKPFPISALVIIEEGNSNILSLA
jgi:large subunit ribosomal protein L30e